jgi:hypothetical protein
MLRVGAMKYEPPKEIEEHELNFKIQKLLNERQINKLKGDLNKLLAQNKILNERIGHSRRLEETIKAFIEK